MQKMTLTGLSLLALILWLTACGSAAQPADTNLAVSEIVQEDNQEAPGESAGSKAEQVAETAPAATSRPETEITAAAMETDAKGLPVGFTDDGRPYRGNPHAPVVIEEFSDFQCPFCARFADQTLPSIEENQIRNGDALLIFYDFPLTNLHPQATAAANAARCAGEQGAPAYWAMHDLLFTDVPAWSSSNATAVFISYAQDLGLEMESFTTCVQNDTYLDAIQADFDLGRSRGISSTPSFFINDQPIIGAQPLAAFDQAIAIIQDGGELPSNGQQQAAQQPFVAPTPAAIVFADHAGVLGNDSAPVTIVEFTDYQCPYCQRHNQETMPQLLEQLVASGRVRYVLKDFPLDSIHPDARQAAVAARCAGEQDLYWEMHDALFANQQQWAGLGAGASTVFTNLAISVGADSSSFEQCLSSGRHDDIIEDNLQEGVRLGVRGTPAFFIDGFPVNGAQPYELFEYAVALAEEGTLADAYKPQEQQQQQQPEPPQEPVEVSTETAVFAIGNPDAPVEIIEYTDFQCPFCQRHFLQTFPQIKAQYIDTGQVRYVFKDLPLTTIHPQAFLAAEAARCAADQGAYLEMHNLLFTTQGEWSGSSAAATMFTDYASQLGLDSDTFSACLTNHAQETAVQADMDEAIGFGISGTPAFFVNGNFVNGAQPFSVFSQVIDKMLADADS